MHGSLISIDCSLFRQSPSVSIAFLYYRTFSQGGRYVLLHRPTLTARNARNYRDAFLSCKASHINRLIHIHTCTSVTGCIACRMQPSKKQDRYMYRSTSIMLAYFLTLILPSRSMHISDPGSDSCGFETFSS